MSTESNAARLRIIRASRQLEQLIATVGAEVRFAAQAIPAADAVAIINRVQGVALYVEDFARYASLLADGLDGAPKPSSTTTINSPNVRGIAASDDSPKIPTMAERQGIDRRFTTQRLASMALTLQKEIVALDSLTNVDTRLQAEGAMQCDRLNLRDVLVTALELVNSMIEASDERRRENQEIAIKLRDPRLEELHGPCPAELLTRYPLESAAAKGNKPSGPFPPCLY